MESHDETLSASDEPIIYNFDNEFLNLDYLKGVEEAIKSSSTHTGDTEKKKAKCSPKDYLDLMNSSDVVKLDNRYLNNHDIKSIANALKQATKVKTLHISLDVTLKGVRKLAQAILINDSLNELKIYSKKSSLAEFLILESAAIVKGISVK